MTTVVLPALSAIAALLSAGAAWGSWRAASHANKTSVTLARIERERWHTELTPQFEITCKRLDPAPTTDLRLTFIGPASLDRLDKVQVVIADDHQREARGCPVDH